MSVYNMFMLLGLHMVTAKVEDWSYSARGKDWEGTCTTGLRQSPINIPFAEPSEFVAINDEHLKTQFDFGESDYLMVENDGSTLNFYFDDDDEITSSIRVPIVGGQLHGILEDGDNSVHNTEYTTAFKYSFHLRTPSEHTYNGYLAPVEGQMVMLMLKEFLPSCPKEACLAIISFQFKENDLDDQESPFLADILSLIGGEWPEEGEMQIATNRTAAYNGTLDFSQLLDGDEEPSYIMYSGSITMPPCDENVLWYVMEKPLPISVEQVDQLQDLFTPDEDGVLRNSRLIQPLNGRRIAYVNSKEKLYQEM